MTPTSLPARLMYTAAAVPLVGLAEFHLCMNLLPEVTAKFPWIDPGGDGYGIFRIAVGTAVVLAVTAGAAALTLPWLRLRKRQGRDRRMVTTAVVVVIAAMGFAAEGGRLLYDLLFAAWLTYTLTFTFVRYGVRDERRRRRRRRRTSRLHAEAGPATPVANAAGTGAVDSGPATG